MTEQLRLVGTSTRRTVGSVERDLQATLRSWRPWLSGKDHAATRATLRESARNVDRALALTRADDDRAPSPYALQMILRVHDELLRLHAPPTQQTVDPLDALHDEG